MPTRLILVRHGATPSSAEDRFAGASNVPLSAVGLEQARSLAERLAEEPLVAVYTSPLDRTVATAEALAEPHRLTPSGVADLREIDHGRWEGHTRAEVEAAYPDEYAAWAQDPYTVAPEGGECGLDVARRALPAVRRIAVAHEGQTVAIVSHKATIRLVLATLLGLDPRGYRDRLDLAPASLTVLELLDPVRARLMVYNDTSHYSPRARRPERNLSAWWDGG